MMAGLYFKIGEQSTTGNKGGVLYMDTSAYIFIEVTQGKSREVSKTIAQCAGVVSSHIVTGPYDIIVFARAQDIQNLWGRLISDIQAIPGVVRTITNIVAE